MNRQQFEVVEYLKEENCVLKAYLGGRRLRLTDTQRRRLAARGHRLGQAIVEAFSRLSLQIVAKGPGAYGVHPEGDVSGPDFFAFARSLK